MGRGRSPFRAHDRAAAPPLSLADGLFPRTKQRLLSILFGQPDRPFTMAELIALVGSGSGAVQREIDRLVASGLVTVTVVGRQKTYQANRASPIFEELCGIVEKTAGIAEVLRDCLGALGEAVQFAVLYGSIAKETASAASDIDLLLVADGLTLEEVLTAIEPAERRLGRRVSPTLYTPEEFRNRRRSGHPFLTKVLAGTHVVLLGSEDDLAAR